MPTAAKLVSTVLFALLAFAAAELFRADTAAGLFKAVIGPETVFGYFSYVCAAVGALCGWFVMGRLVGHGVRAAMGSGVRTAVTVVFLVLLIFAGREMIFRAMKLRYHGPMDALQGMFGLALDYGRLLLAPDLLAVLFIGGVVGGALAERAGRTWR